MKENIFTHKILPILSILLLVSFIFISNNAFALEVSEDTVPSLDFLDRVVFTEDGYYKLIDFNGSTICTDYMILHSSTYNSYNVIFFNGNSFYLDGNSFTFTDTSSNNYINLEYKADGTFSHVTCDGGIASSFQGWWDYLHTSTCDIYNKDGTIFFQKAPVTSVEIPALETVEQIPETITKTLKLIIPVGLVVLSVVLLIYLTRRLICRCS